MITKYINIFKIAPKYFGSQGIHHQGALHCIKLPDDGSLVIRNMLEKF